MSVLILALAVILAVMALTQKNTVPAVLAFVMMMFLLGIYYILMDEKLLGLFQIFVYTGGISVLMLFGITLIGVEFEETKGKGVYAFLAFMVFVGSVVLFFQNEVLLKIYEHGFVENKALFADSYSEYVLLFALLASSLLYGTIKAMKTLKKTRKEDV